MEPKYTFNPDVIRNENTISIIDYSKGIMEIETLDSKEDPEKIVVIAGNARIELDRKDMFLLGAALLTYSKQYQHLITDEDDLFGEVYDDDDEDVEM